MEGKKKTLLRPKRKRRMILKANFKCNRRNGMCWIEMVQNMVQGEEVYEYRN